MLRLLLFPEVHSAAADTPSAVDPAIPSNEANGDQTNKPDKKKGHGRRPLPDSLPRIRHTHTLTDAECACPECGTRRLKIGEEISEQLAYQPASLFVIQQVRDTLACPKCQGHVTTAPLFGSGSQDFRELP